MMASRYSKILLLFVVLSLALTGCAKTSSQKEAFDYETDIVVVGGGGAGLVSAISAAEKGADVILLEKLSILGGATMMSAGIIPAAGTHFQKQAGIKDTPKAMARDIFRPGHYSQRKDLVNLIADKSSDMIDWMEKLGIKWHLQTDVLYKGQTNYRMHQAEGKGGEIIKVLKDEAGKNKKIKIMTETPGTGLIEEDGKVIGVTAKKDDKEIRIKAKAVILATSGFAANKDMVKEYIPQVEGSYPQVAPGATGEGIKWGQKLGAKVANMGAYQGYAPISNKTKKSLGSFILNNGGILINKDTERFTDEYLGYSELSAHIVNQPEHVAYMIFDSNIAQQIEEDMDKYQEDEILVTAETPEDLAKKLKLDPTKMKMAFDDYIDGISKGEDRFNRTKLPGKWEGPFYAIEVTSDLRHTQGGLVIDKKARVIKDDGNPIPGLYAAGGVTEGFSSSGGPAYMSGNGLLQAFILGRIAGQEAAELK